MLSSKGPTDLPGLSWLETFHVTTSFWKETSSAFFIFIFSSCLCSQEQTGLLPPPPRRSFSSVSFSFLSQFLLSREHFVSPLSQYPCPWSLLQFVRGLSGLDPITPNLRLSLEYFPQAMHGLVWVSASLMFEDPGPFPAPILFFFGHTLKDQVYRNSWSPGGKRELPSPYLLSCLLGIPPPL